jgi:hypothetical protein
MGKVGIFIIILCSGILGCGGGTDSNSSGGVVGATGSGSNLPLAQAQSKGSASNQAVLNLVQNTSSFLGAPPSSNSKLKVTRQYGSLEKLHKLSVKMAFGLPMAKEKSTYGIPKAKGFVAPLSNNGTYTIHAYDTDSSITAFDLNFTITFRTATGTAILGDDFSALQRADFTVSGYETFDSVRYNYSNANFTISLLSSTSFTMSGAGNVTSSDGSNFHMTVSGINADLSTGKVTGGQVKLTGNDGEKDIVVTSTFQTNGVPIIEVQDSGVLVESQVVAFPTVTANNGAAIFESNSALITHPFIGDMVQGGTKVYTGSVQVGLDVEPIAVSISKSNSLLKVCGITSKRIYMAATSAETGYSEEGYIAQDANGNLFNLGSTDALPSNCNNLFLELPLNLSEGQTWQSTNYDGFNWTSTVLGTNIAYQGFTGLTRLREEGSGFFEGEFVTGTTDSYFNSTYGLAFTEGTVSTANGTAYVFFRRVP